MRLVQIEIEGYRSVAAPIALHLDPNVTVILGANDHGKSNLLEALTHLNGDKKFDPERDLNWDMTDDPKNFPFLSFEFELDEADRRNLLELSNAALAAEPATTTAGAAPTSPPAVAVPGSVPPAATTPVAEPTGATEPVPAPVLTLAKMPATLRVQKVGVEGSLTCIAFNELPKGLATKFFNQARPRVELIKPQESVPDSVNAAELLTDAHQFMRGIFYYAGLDAKNAGKLFEQTDTTMKRLEGASAELNRTLKADWTQGAELAFLLAHDSKSGNIILRMKDPAIGGRLARASQRSSGFTHFFTLKTVLHARQTEHPANSYIFLFDEPGIYLHPAGQYDLLEVLDTIGRSNQIVYSTHSIFMVNKTFPTRHRLLVKTEKGTSLDGKPFVGRWGPALEALGLSLAGTILFAQYILLAEGDSDPILIPAVFQKLVALKQADIDLNGLSVIATGNSKNTDALIRILIESGNRPKLAVLVDGDEGGKARVKNVQALLKAQEIKSQLLAEDTTIEDYLPLVGELYVKAVAEYVIKVSETQGDHRDALREKFRKSFRESFEEGKVTKGVASWASTAGQKLGELDGPPSKVGIAREYVSLLHAAPSENFTPQTLQRPLKLVEWVQDMLKIPPIREAARRILREPS